jgi:hypothetical protein
VQPSQDNCDHMVKKFENGSTITYVGLPQINSKTSYQKIFFVKNLVKRLIRPRSRGKLISSALSAQHWDTSHPNVPIRKMSKQISLEDK